MASYQYGNDDQKPPYATLPSNYNATQNDNRPKNSQPPHVGFVYPTNPTPVLPQPGFVPLVPPANNFAFGNNPSNDFNTGVDPESLLVKGFDFSEASIRRGFIRKVYAILSCQLLITLGFIFLFGYEENTRQFVSSTPSLLYIALAVVLGTMIAICCCENARRTSPMNLICLGIFTFGESYLVGMTTIFYERSDVLLAIGITTAVCVSLTIFALQTKWDFTVMGGVLFVGLILFFIFGIIAMFMPGKLMTLVYSAIGAILFGFYLIYDTQKMMGGDHKYSISPEEYVFASLALYLDIINMFLHILAMINAVKK